MDAASVLLLVVGLPLTLFLPGYLLTWALWPRKHTLHATHDGLVRTALAVPFSLLLTIVVTFALGFLRAATRPGVLLAMVGVALALAGLAAWRARIAASRSA